MTAETRCDGAPRVSGQARFLRGFFSALVTEGVNYCVLRDWQGLPETAAGHDLDVLVDAAALDRAFAMSRSSAMACGGHLICSYRRSAVIARYLGVGPEPWPAALDLYPKLEFRGLQICSASLLLESAVEHGGVKVAHPAVGALLSLLKQVLAHGADKKHYAREAHVVLSGEGDARLVTAVLAELDAHFGAGFADEMRSAVLQPTDPSRLRAFGLAARRRLLSWAVRRHPVRTVTAKVITHAERAGRLVRRPSAWVVLMGTDGAGKTTVIDTIRPQLEAALHGRVHVRHLRPGLLPPLARLIGRQAVSGPVRDPHAAPPSGFLGSMVRLAYYYVDYLVGYHVAVRPELCRRPCAFLFDRYLYDVLVDPARTRIALPRWILRTACRLAPRPDLLLCLGAGAEIMHLRKPEQTLPEIEQQVEKLRALCASAREAVWVDTSGTVDESARAALRAIAEAMARSCRPPRGGRA